MLNWDDPIGKIKSTDEQVKVKNVALDPRNDLIVDEEKVEQIAKSPDFLRSARSEKATTMTQRATGLEELEFV